MSSKRLNIAGIADSSTIDYIGKVSAVIYLCGCPFRCPWCQNPDLALGNAEVLKSIKLGDIVDSVRENFLIGAVSLTGGEPLMQEDTIALIESLKRETGLLLKIDTNGFYPERLEEALPFLDSVSMDLKAPIDEGYDEMVGLSKNVIRSGEKIKRSLDILKKWDKLKEARTTIIPGLTDKQEVLLKIAESVEYAGFDYYTLDNSGPEHALTTDSINLKAREKNSCT